MYKYKDFTVQFKDGENGNGVICGYASTWDKVPDAYGDIVRKGAFADCLKKYEETGRVIPFVWSHRLDDINSYLGSVNTVYEDDKGLYFEATLDDTPEAQRVRELFKTGRLSKFSFAYNILDEGPVTLENGVKANELRKLDIFEITACLIPANSFAEVTDVKCNECEGIDITLPEKSGKRNSSKDEEILRNAIALLQSMLGEVSDDNSDAEAEKADSSEGSKEVNSAEKEQPAINEQKAFDAEAQEKLLSILRNL